MVVSEVLPSLRSAPFFTLVGLARETQGGTTSLRYVTRKRINNEHSNRARDTSMPVECMQDF